MKVYAYCIYDRKATIYHPPFYQPADGAAVRVLSDLANDATTHIGRHPGDYVLYCVGIFDDSNASFMAHSPILHVIDASALVKIQPQLDLRQKLAIDNTPYVGNDMGA